MHLDYENGKRGCKVDTVHLSNLQFANNIVLLSTENVVENIITDNNEGNIKYRLKVKMGLSKIMFNRSSLYTDVNRYSKDLTDISRIWHK